MVTLQDQSSVIGNLEYREAGRVITGQFPYGTYAQIKQIGPVRRERFSPRAFRASVQNPASDIQLLVGHDGNKPLASKEAGNLVLEDRPDGVYFEAQLPPEHERPTWMQDAVLAIKGGLIRGVSPGFKATAEGLEIDPDYPQYQCRVIGQADLHEFSVLPKAAYKDGIVDVRASLGAKLGLVAAAAGLYQASKAANALHAKANEGMWALTDKIQPGPFFVDPRTREDGDMDLLEEREFEEMLGRMEEKRKLPMGALKEVFSMALEQAILKGTTDALTDVGDDRAEGEMTPEERAALAWL